MKHSKEKLVLLSANVLILVVVIFAGNSKFLSRVTLGCLFSVLFWMRTGRHFSRWLAIAVMWAGILLPAMWP